VCRSCGLAQLADDSPVETDDPAGPSPWSSVTMAQHGERFADDLVERGLATASSRILSMGSHGGDLSPFLAARGVPAVALGSSEGGPATHPAAQPGPGRLPGELPEPDAGGYDLIVDSYLLAHLPSPRSALRRLARMLRPGGTLVLEFDDLLAKVVGDQWDVISHGHQTYLSVGWLARELAEAGLSMVDVVALPVYGGASRAYARAGHPTSADVRQVLTREAAAGIDRPEGLARLATAVARARDEVPPHLAQARDAGRRVAGYGAPARSVTFLNALDIGPDVIPFVVDRSPAKQGRVIPGVGIPIREPAALDDFAPAEVLILTWNLATEVRASLRSPALASTRFMVAVPRLADVPAPAGADVAAASAP
jgi:SAM-dependent methyltransferase